MFSALGPLGGHDVKLGTRGTDEVVPDHTQEAGFHTLCCEPLSVELCLASSPCSSSADRTIFARKKCLKNIWNLSENVAVFARHVS